MAILISTPCFFIDYPPTLQGIPSVSKSSFCLPLNNPLKKQQQQQSFSKTTMIILTIHTLKTLPFDSLVASALTLWVPLVLNVFPLRARLSSRGDFICLSSQLVSPSSSCSHCLTFYFSMSSGAGSTGLGCFTNYT